MASVKRGVSNRGPLVGTVHWEVSKGGLEGEMGDPRAKFTYFKFHQKANKNF